MGKEKRTSALELCWTEGVSSFVSFQDSCNPASLINITAGLTAVDSSAQVTTHHHRHNQVMMNCLEKIVTGSCFIIIIIIIFINLINTKRKKIITLQ